MTSETTVKIEHIDEDVFQKSWSWWHVGAVFGLFGGLAAILIGIILTFVIWFLNYETIHLSLQTLTNILFYSAFPLLFFGAYCLDKISEIIKKKSPDNLTK